MPDHARRPGLIVSAIAALVAPGHNRIPVTPVHKAKSTVYKLLEAEVRYVEEGKI